MYNAWWLQHSIGDEDIFSFDFDEIGVAIGLTATTKIITRVEYRVKNQQAMTRILKYEEVELEILQDSKKNRLN